MSRYAQFNQIKLMRIDSILEDSLICTVFHFSEENIDDINSFDLVKIVNVLIYSIF